MTLVSMSGKNIKLVWSNSSEKRQIASLKDKIPRYEIDQDGDSILSFYEFPQESVAEILKKFDLSDLEIDARAAKVFNQYINESTPMEDLPPIDLSSIEFPIKPRDFQLKFLRVNAAKKNILLNMSVGSGKAQPLYARVLTPKGWKKMGSLGKGDLVIGGDGLPKKVLGVHYQGIRPIYEITFSDGTKVRCDENHLWKVQNSAMRFRTPEKFKIKSLKTIIKSYKGYDGRRNCFLPMVEPIQFIENPNLTIDPYTLGLFLGDGSLSRGCSVGYTSADFELVEYLTNNLPKGVTIRKKPNSDYGYYINGNPNTLARELRKLKLLPIKCENRFVPTGYKFGSIDTRLSVLQGLLDTDGYIDARKPTCVDFCSKSHQLVIDVMEITQSLGGNAYQTKTRVINGVNYYRTTLVLTMCPFRLSRKVNNWKIPTKYFPYKCIDSIEYIGEEAAQCISVEDELYVTDGYTVTHNSLTAAYRCKILAGHNDFKLLIIAPKKLVVTSKWQREIRKCLERDSLNFWAIGAAKRQKLLDQVPNYSIIITTYDQASFLTGFKPDFIVIDEAHLIRGEKTKRHKGVKKHITANPNAVKLLLTGTPRPSRLEGFWTLIKMVAPTIAGNKKAFLNKFQKVQRYIQIEKTLPSGLITSYKHPITFKDINMDELHSLISPVVYTVPKADITTYEDCLDFTDIEMLPKQKKAYYTVANEFLQRKKDGNLAYEDALLYTLRLRQIAEGLFNLPEYQSLESNKLDYAIATIDELDEDEKLIIWSCYQEGTNLLYERYKDRAVLFNGTVSAARTKLGVYAFNNIDTEEEFNEYEQMARRQKNWNFKPGEAQLLFGVIHEISSIGLDFQRECHKQQVMAQSDLMATDEQALARVRRLGQESPFVYSEYVFSNNTMERSKMERKLENAKNTAHATQGRNSSSYDMIEEMIRMVKETL